MKWDEVEALRDTFSALVPYVQQMTAEMVSALFCFYKLFILNALKRLKAAISKLYKFINVY